jgi:hypothetical protein
LILLQCVILSPHDAHLILECKLETGSCQAAHMRGQLLEAGIRVDIKHSDGVVDKQLCRNELVLIRPLTWRSSAQSFCLCCE